MRNWFFLVLALTCSVAPAGALPRLGRGAIRDGEGITGAKAESTSSGAIQIQSDGLVTANTPAPAQFYGFSHISSATYPSTEAPAAPAARTPGLDLGGVVRFIAEKAVDAKGATAVNLDLGVSGALYLPVLTLHARDRGQRADEPAAMADYFEVGVGGELLEGGRARPFLNAGLNVPALFRRVSRSPWWKDHVAFVDLPPIWAGPFVRLPTTRGPWVIGSEVGAFVAIALGGSK